ncbi:MAG: hypothetical protein ACK4WH_15195 [Phycisphaerales bacterium]
MSPKFCIVVRFSALAWLIVLPAVASLQPDAGKPAVPDTTPAQTARLPLTFSDCVVIGASVSAGAEVSLPGFPPAIIDGHCNLADALAASLGPAKVVVTPESARGRLNALAPISLASWRFFEGPEAMAERQLAAVKGMKPAPKIVFAIDYLFWHAYGFSPDDDHRRERFRRGLDRLASLPPSTTIVVADLPDMTHAIGLMLSKPMVPTVELQVELNAALADWASNHDRANVLILPLRTTVANAWASKPVTLGGKAYEGEASRGLLTNSGLHSTAEGLIALSQEILDQLSAKGRLPVDAKWERDHAVVLQRLVDAKKALDQIKKDAVLKATAPKPDRDAHGRPEGEGK